MAELVLVAEDAVQRHTQLGPHQPAQLAVVVVVLRDQMSVSEVGREVVSGVPQYLNILTCLWYPVWKSAS